MFIPLMGGRENAKTRLDRTIRLTKRLNKPEHERHQMIAMELVLMDKFITPDEMDQYWKEVSMLNIIKYAESRGKAEGRAELLWKMVMKKFPKIPAQYYEKVKQMNADQMENFGLEILDMKDPEELDRFL